MKTFLMMLVLLLSAIVATGGSQVKPQQWEYKFAYQCDEKKANNLASEGWELADMSMANYGSIGVATCVFRRMK